MKTRSPRTPPADVVDVVGEASADPEESPAESSDAASTRSAAWNGRWQRVVVYGVLPGLALILAVGAGFLRWQDFTVRDSGVAGTESLHAARDSTVALLSYRPDTADQQLNAARDLLTGEFRDSYTRLITDVVVPGAKEKQITAEATVPAGASVSADERHAVALLYVNQRTVIGSGPPSDLKSSIRISMDKVDGRWLISRFDPV